MHYYKRIVMFKIQKLVKLVLYMYHQLKKLQGDRIRENGYNRKKKAISALSWKQYLQI